MQLRWAQTEPFAHCGAPTAHAARHHDTEGDAHLKIGILGAGQMAQALARPWLRAGHEIALTSAGGPSSIAALVRALGQGARAIEVPELAVFGDVIVLATRWPQLPDAIAALGTVSGKVVIDATNNRIGPRPEDLIDTGARGSSEVVADMLPGARVVKAFNHLPIPALAELGRTTRGAAGGLFIAGDDANAKAIVSQLVLDLGATPIDTGSLADGGRLQSTGRGPLAGFGRLLPEDEARDALARARLDRAPDRRHR